MRHPSLSYTRALILALGASLSVLGGCASLALRSYDNAGVTAAKVLARIPLGIATLGVSELAIEEAIRPSQGCNAACLAILLGAGMSRPAPVYAPTYPVYVPTVQQPRNCTSYPVGNTIQTNCW
jgi:hypothetical protein